MRSFVPPNTTDFLDWLEAHPRNAVIGFQESEENCPLAYYLDDMYAEDTPHVIVRGRAIAMTLPDKVEAVIFPINNILRAFVDAVDFKAIPGAAIHAGPAADVLNEIIATGGRSCTAELNEKLAMRR